MSSFLFGLLVFLGFVLAVALLRDGRYSVGKPKVLYVNVGELASVEFALHKKKRGALRMRPVAESCELSISQTSQYFSHQPPAQASTDTGRVTVQVEGLREGTGFIELLATSELDGKKYRPNPTEVRVIG